MEAATQVAHREENASQKLLGKDTKHEDLSKHNSSLSSAHQPEEENRSCRIRDKQQQLEVPPAFCPKLLLRRRAYSLSPASAPEKEFQLRHFIAVRLWAKQLHLCGFPFPHLQMGIKMIPYKDVARIIQYL